MEELAKSVEESATKFETHDGGSDCPQGVSSEDWAGDAWSFDELMKDQVASAFEEMVRILKEGR